MSKITSTLLYSLTGAAAIASLPSCKANKEAEAPKKMNVIYIMSDDHSYQTISAYDQRYIHTPNIDRIGNEGEPRRYLRCWEPAGPESSTSHGSTPCNPRS